MIIKSVSIIGLGLIGGSLAKGFKENFPDIVVSAYDLPATLETAINQKVIDTKLIDPFDSLKSDLIIISLPVDHAVNIFELLIPFLNKKQVITDVCGIKEPFEKIWKEKSVKGIYIGTHPMTGKEKGGFDNSDILLFQNSVFIFSDLYKNRIAVKELAKIYTAFGARITFLSAKLHDEIVAYVSHLPQLLSVALVNSVAKNKNGKDFIDFAAGGFKDMTRIASSNFNVWEPVLIENKSNIIKSLQTIEKQIQNTIHNLNDENTKKIGKDFLKSRNARSKIPQNFKGFLSPLYELNLLVEDKPGVLSYITTSMYKANINIKDIELIKIREGFGGTFRLLFESASDVENATKILKKITIQNK
ncbi:MAG: prephenate dehydrogenase/arogenate dehydrogenase family protein [Melioribacteraceae bacterium]|nr:prephenate dehydrogenase/arogenate dehydrogenase family protein [Melioribacteraceae bacterium]